MDLNQLFADHQRALHGAQRSASDNDRQTCRDLAKTYAQQFNRFRTRHDLPLYRWA